MKRLLFSVFALALGSFVFMSCDDDKIGDEGKDGEKYMTLTEQQQAIQASLEGVANAIEFTELSQAAAVVGEVVGKKWSYMSLMPILSDTTLMKDTAFISKISYAISLINGDFDVFDGMTIDLSPLFMEVDMQVVDSVIYGDTVAAVVINRFKSDVDHLLINVAIDDHDVSLKAKVVQGTTTLNYYNADRELSSHVALPELVEVTLTLDGSVLASVKGDFDSDYTISFTDNGSDDESFVVDGTRMSASVSVKAVGYDLGGSLNYNETTGFTCNLSAKYGNTELLSIGGKLDAVFKDVDFTDSIAMLVWVQNPEMLKSVSGNASLGGGQIEIKGSLENPFKDEALAKYMRSLMAGTILTDDQFEDMVAKFNELFKVGVYFKGYEKPQAVMKVKYIKDQKANADKDDDEESSIIDAVGDLVKEVSSYLVMEVRDEKGKTYEVSVEDYFKGVDINQFKQVIMDKVLKVVGPLMAQFDMDEEDED